MALCLSSLLAQAADNTAAPQPTLGTLFYTSAERSSMARARTGEAADAAQPTSNILGVTGLVRRQGGHSTMWLNGQPVPEGNTTAQGHTPRSTANGIEINGTGLRVGESLDLSTGQRSDVLAPGSVTIQGH